MYINQTCTASMLNAKVAVACARYGLSQGMLCLDAAHHHR